MIKSNNLLFYFLQQKTVDNVDFVFIDENNDLLWLWGFVDKNKTILRKSAFQKST